MKTAMQELIEHIQENATKFNIMNTYNILKEIEPYLEKEKQQIKNAYIIGFSDCHSSSAKDQDLYFNIMYNGKDL